MFWRRLSSKSKRSAVLVLLLGMPACAIVAGLEDKELYVPAESGGGDTAGEAGTGASGGVPGEGGLGGVSSQAGDATRGGAAGGTVDPPHEGGAGASGGELAPPPSCASGEPGAGKNCGLSGTEDCCDSPIVEGGDFERHLNGLGLQPFRVSNFRLDRFEVTVARFRQFARAVKDGFVPKPGDGKHTHLKDGFAPGEMGWLAEFDEPLSVSVESCLNHNYTSAPGANDKQPIVCTSYYHALAFCIWDGGYLPSSTELLYVYGRWDENLPYYPWGKELEPSRAVYATTSLADVGSKPAGQGRFGHHDLIGNAAEISVDNLMDHHGCDADCAYIRLDWPGFTFGLSFESSAEEIEQGYHEILEGREGNDETGFRCARAP